MRVGICSSDFTAVPAEDLFAKMRKYNFESTQFSFVSITESEFVPSGQIEFPGYISDDVIKLVIRSAEKYNVQIMGCNGTFNMAHPEKEVRDEGIERFKDYAQTVKRLGVNIITLCSGTRDRDYLWTYHEDNGTDEAWADMVESMKRVTEIAEKNGIVLALETEAANVVDTPEKARFLMDTIGSANLKMIIDCANLFHAGKAKKKNVHSVVAHAFEVFGKDMVIAHGKDIMESDGIDFCPTGEGIIDFDQFTGLLMQYGYKGDMLLHGIYEEEKMPFGYEVAMKAIKNVQVN